LKIIKSFLVSIIATVLFQFIFLDLFLEDKTNAQIDRRTLMIFVLTFFISVLQKKDIIKQNWIY